MTHSLLAYLAIALYLGSGLLLTLRLFFRDRLQPPGRALTLLPGLAGVLAHTLVLYQEVLVPPGINLGFFTALSLASWTVVALFLLSSLTKPVENLGILLFPVAAVTIYLDVRLPSLHLLRQEATWALKLHVLTSMLAYSLLTLASVQAVLLAIQDQHLRQRHPGGFIRTLPPLQTMETLLFEMIGAGYVLLTLALLSGFVFLEDMFAQHLVHKTVLSLLGWFVFGTLLLGRLRYGWRGRTALIWTLSGYLILILAYFGSKAVLELILQR